MWCPSINECMRSSIYCWVKVGFKFYRIEFASIVQIGLLLNEFKTWNCWMCHQSCEYKSIIPNSRGRLSVWLPHLWWNTTWLLELRLLNQIPQLPSICKYHKSSAVHLQDSNFSVAVCKGEQKPTQSADKASYIDDIHYHCQNDFTHLHLNQQSPSFNENQKSSAAYFQHNYNQKVYCGLKPNSCHLSNIECPSAKLVVKCALINKLPHPDDGVTMAW